MSAPRIVALSGGIGGAKLSLGLYRVLPPGTLTVIVNTGDDFDHLGAADLPGHRHHALYARRPRQHATRLGPLR